MVAAACGRIGFNDHFDERVPWRSSNVLAQAVHTRRARAISMQKASDSSGYAANMLISPLSRRSSRNTNISCTCSTASPPMGSGLNTVASWLRESRDLVVICGLNCRPTEERRRGLLHPFAEGLASGDALLD